MTKGRQERGSDLLDSLSAATLSEGEPICWARSSVRSISLKRDREACCGHKRYFTMYTIYNAPLMEICQSRSMVLLTPKAYGLSRHLLLTPDIVLKPSYGRHTQVLG